MEYYSATKKNEMLSFIIQSEVSQKEKNKYYVLHTHIYKGSKHKLKKI